jgi:hypothetical protein
MGAILFLGMLNLLRGNIMSTKDYKNCTSYNLVEEEPNYSKEEILFATFSVLSTRWPKAMNLLHQMIAHSNQDSVYKESFDYWLKFGSTLRLRELISEFGSYLGSLDFRNQVNAIDTAHFNAGRLHDPENESGELYPEYTDKQYGMIYNIRKVDLELNSNTIHCCIPSRFL